MAMKEEAPTREAGAESKLAIAGEQPTTSRSLSDIDGVATSQSAPVQQQVAAGQPSADEPRLDVFICVNTDATATTQPTTNGAVTTQPSLEVP
jgi:hypothetical protein